MNCKRCGAALAPDALGCPVCGEPAEGAGAGVTFSGFAADAGLQPLSAADLPEISSSLPDGANADEGADAADAADATDATDAPGADAAAAGADDAFDETRKLAGYDDGFAGGGDAFADDAFAAGGDGFSGGAATDAEQGGADPFAPSPVPVFTPSPIFATHDEQPFQQPGEAPVLGAPLQPVYAAPDAAYAPAPAPARPRMRTGSKVLIGLVVVVLLAALAGIAAVWTVNTHLAAEANVRYTVTYETNGGSRVESQEVKTGTMITAPREPTISGRYFAGWYTDTTYQTQVTFPLEVASDMTLYARWTRDKDKADKALAAQDSTQNASQDTSQSATQSTSQDAAAGDAQSQDAQTQGK